MSEGERLYKKMEIAKWGVGVLVAIFLGGFSVAIFFGQYETKETVEKREADHEEVHKLLDGKLDNHEQRLIKVRIYQVRSEEREKLINRRLEFLVEQTKTAGDRRRPTPVKAQALEDLEQEIRVQEALVERVERDPTAGLPTGEL